MSHYKPHLIASRLLSAMKSRGLDRIDLAKRSGITYSSVIKVLNGSNKNPTLRILMGLSKAVGQPIQWFIE